MSLRVFLVNSARSAADKVVVGGPSTLGLLSTDLRDERGRWNTGLGVVGMGGFGRGLKEREGGLEERGELLRDVDFAVRYS